MEKQDIMATLPQPQQPSTKTTEYKVGGNLVKLSESMVINYLTKGNTSVTKADVVGFIQLCAMKKLNPWLGECYLVKYGNAPAEVITSKEAYMKRAEECEAYDGLSAGIIVMRDDNVMELEGTFYLPTDTLLGGWCRVYRKDRCNPYYAAVRLCDYDKGQSLWNKMKATMIRKVAVVQALREAFPVQLGAMYIREETSTNTVNVDSVEVVDVPAEVVAQNSTEIKDN